MLTQHQSRKLAGREVTGYYILRGEGPETYEPRFTYHGFRYVEVTGFPGTRAWTVCVAASSTLR